MVKNIIYTKGILHYLVYSRNSVNINFLLAHGPVRNADLPTYLTAVMYLHSEQKPY